MLKNIALGFGALALAVASAATHNVQIFDKVTVNGQELKPGNYSVEVEGNRALIRKGKQTIEAPVTIAESPKKHDRTSVRFDTSSGESRIAEIRVGGSTQRIVFADQTAATR